MTISAPNSSNTRSTPLTPLVWSLNQRSTSMTGVSKVIVPRLPKSTIQEFIPE